VRKIFKKVMDLNWFSEFLA